MPTKPPPEPPQHWHDLPQSAREELEFVMRLLAVDRFTGEIRLQCLQGGISEWYEEKRHARRRHT